MDERWQKVERTYYAALEMEGTAREEYLARACAGDPALRAELETLLGYARRGTSSPQTTPVETVAETPGIDEPLPDLADATVEIGGMVAHYRLTAKIGEGRMGDVYRAHNTKLQCDVALRILPEALARDAQRMARFEQEAQVLASLNHPNIAAIHGLEKSRGIRALVMELVEGETLAERLGRPGASVRSSLVPANGRPQASTLQGLLPLARQIAEALEYAHERGVVHLDLTPPNVKIVPGGTVKVLDFGLASVMGPQDSSAESGPANSPTQGATSAKPGMISGTAAYMSPEQLTGGSVDRRCDIWAFGCILFEMLAERRAFEGKTISDVSAAVTAKEPDWNALPETTPQSIQKLIRRCLQKDVRQRLQAIGEARITIEEALSGDAVATPVPVPAGAAPARSKWSLLRRAAPWAVAAVFAAVALYAVLAHRKKAPPPLPPKPAVEASILPPPNTAFRSYGFGAGPVVVSPDGKQLAFSATDKSGVTRLYVRSLTSDKAKAIAKTEGAASPFWSPDGSSLGFFAGQKLKTVNLSNGKVQALADAPCGLSSAGAWSGTGTILFTPDCSGQLEQISSSGGKPGLIANLGGDQERQEPPTFLPDGQHFLYVSFAGAGPAGSIWMGSLGKGEGKLVLKDASFPAFASGHLLFRRGGEVFAQPFDPATGRLAGEATALAGGWNYSVSDTGVLAYQDGRPFGRMEWVDRGGNPLGTVGPVALYTAARISPDGKQVLATVDDLQSGSVDVWSYPAAGGPGTQLTSGPGRKAWSVWSPDGKHIAYSCQSDGNQGICRSAVDGSGTAEKLLSLGDGILNLNVTDWSPDGRYLAFNEYVTKGSRRVDWIFPLTGDHKAFHPTTDNASQAGPLFSPDRRWVAFVSDQTGRPEVYVGPFPYRGAEFQISKDGGWDPRWDRKGRLYFLSLDNRMMEAELKTSVKAVQVKSITPLFELNLPVFPTPLFDVTADGSRFLVVTRTDSAASRSIGLVLNWESKLTGTDRPAGKNKTTGVVKPAGTAGPS